MPVILSVVGCVAVWRFDAGDFVGGGVRCRFAF
jgi:hypothetical protein